MPDGPKGSVSLSSTGPTTNLDTLRASGRKQVVFAGHGSFNSDTDKNFPKVRLPQGVTLVFWCHHGEELLDAIGQFVESRKPLSQLPDHLQAMAEKAGYDKKGIPEVVEGGSEIWNYRLTYPSTLTLGATPGTVKASVYNQPVNPGANAHKTLPAAVKDDAYCIVPPLSGDIKDRGVPIIAMLAGYWNVCNGSIVHWCACRSIRAR